jgi:hypothetical protein
VGYAGAALPLWEELLERLVRWPDALRALLPCDDMGAHLQQLAQLYETPAPLLAETYVILASLDATSLPGAFPYPYCLVPLMRKQYVMKGMI